MTNMINKFKNHFHGKKENFSNYSKPPPIHGSAIMNNYIFQQFLEKHLI